MKRIISSKVHASIANFHCSSFLSSQQPQDFAKQQSITNRQQKGENSGDFADLLKKADRTIKDPSLKRLSRLTYHFALSSTVDTMSTKTIKTTKLITPVADVEKFTSPYAHLFREEMTDPIANFSERPSQTFEYSNEELARVHLFQKCLRMEEPFRYEINMSSTEAKFLKTLEEYEKEIIGGNFPPTEKQMKFLMLKWAKKNTNKRRKKYTSEKSVKELDPYAFRNCILPRINKILMKNWEAANLLWSNQYNQPLIFDMRFHKKIDDCSVSLVQQLGTSIARNSCSPDPFYMLLCNCDMTSDVYKKLVRVEGERILNNCLITNESYSSLHSIVDNDSLVYLSPDATRVMTEFCHDKVYIIGGLVDKYTEKVLTKTICKVEGIRCERLPLQQFLKWGGVGGRVDLPINIVAEMLFSLKSTGSWIEALRCIPYRLHRGLTDMGKELANYNPDVIASFERGKHWVEKKDRWVLPSKGAPSPHDRARKYLRQ